ncbi:MAG: undecaprenyl/decaprenyl-phosphate alpha-N-acetylglucosaminyl 1-phosphate transferase [Candidatus Gastranaerophilales bacterium]|nr:undecaprenyl/decaprenyl-phosphate alpha-N-acetylglucosaminyl 1-phosphate transferase [Candidatus Gastranaerophilales bacterium]
MTFLQLSEANIIGTVIAFILGIFLVPLVIAFSEKQGLLDRPNSRKIHSHPIPRLGGAAIWFCTMLSFLSLIILSYYPYRSLLSGLLLGSSLMFLLGLVDDIYGLNAKFKFLIQITIAAIVYCLGVKITCIFIPFTGLVNLNPVLSFIGTICWIVGISNAVNFIDGVDGLAGSVITVSSVTLGLITAAIIPSDVVGPLVAFILAGSMLGFLTYNFHPAKIFMGDSGALFAGFLLASLSIIFQMKTTDFKMYLPLIILAVPILDITFSSLRRILKGTSPFKADAEHIHHKLLKLGLSQNKAVLVLVIFSILMGWLATYIAASDTTKYFLYAVIISAIMIVLNRHAKFGEDSKK